MLGARRQNRIKALTDVLVRAGGKALAVTTDVTDRAQVKRLVDAAMQTFGRVDVMINNAGLMPQELLELLKVNDRRQHKGVLHGIAAVLPIADRTANRLAFLVAVHQITRGGGAGTKGQVLRLWLRADKTMSQMEAA